ncbi:ABC transporter [Pseudoclavibacter endophyticus]|uniref:ABC transporter permease n=1 Tax=Pseudoclavibacter endophyticus TaxID=1778590 RepID=A0A6H9WQG9_9MICO|nr:ABC transporter permease [Pseudoclavibacter endophyticus]KAB1649035.1 ABC transporter permease [Pseudoclavibacter endophyticus]GGA66021.1 ABC transporter [Pseudoclavibacter endophyticus]
MTTLSQHDQQPATPSHSSPPPRGRPGGAPAADADRALVGGVGLAVTHAKWILIETFRVPIAWIGGMLFPVLAFSFFALPIPAVRDDSAAAMQAIVSMMVFGFLANGLFSLGLELASQRAKPWAPYLRTLPGRRGARIVGLITATLVTALISVVPVLVVGLLFTAAAPDPGRLALGIATVVATSVPAALIGLIIGTTCGEKAAIAVTQLVMFVMAFASGLFLPPMMFPAWLEVATRFLPVRAARELSLSVATGTPVEWWMLVSFLVWTVVLAVVGVVLFRRDEGRRFR